MRFCKYCGTKLEDGQECTCAEAVAAAKEKADKAEKAAETEKKLIADFSEVPDEETAPEKSIPEEKAEDVSEESVDASAPENIDDKGDDKQEKAEENKNAPAVAEAKALSVPANTISDKMLKRGLAVFGALALGLILFITVLGNLAGNGYKRPVRNVVKGLNKDRAELERVHDDNFMLVHMTGMRQPKEVYISSIMDGTLNYYSAEHEDIQVEVKGDTAVLIGKSRVTAAVFGGGKHTWRLQLRFQLMKKNGEWRFALASVSTY
ncbi:nuclear transport factor 2 family protein [uncultured Ruminococcus sp.]|uniref:nuclear transport factor 2 family protein n=1 Tax=uncultured Ruminococcus sp. TaxID=165186 RepID=UPI0025CD5A85|nr:nuclear transport factor 2 family protein [uncultured Ruminococcus sp.]